MDMSSGGKGKIEFKEKLPQLPRQGVPHEENKGFADNNNFLAYGDQVKLVPSRSQCRSNRTKIKTTQTILQHNLIKIK